MRVPRVRHARPADLLLLTVLDVVVILLTWIEKRRVKRASNPQ